MKTFKLLIKYITGCCFCCNVMLTSHAQVAETRTRVAELVAVTRPGYYIRQKVLNLTANLDPCALSIGCRQLPLPVQLLYFTGERLNQEHVLLRWETGGEVNNDYFQIERALNPTWGFAPVGVVRGNGDASANVKYLFTDQNDYNTYTYYRLKQIDLDGSFRYSTMIAIRGGSGPLVITPFPNPGQARTIRFRMSGLRTTSSGAISVLDIQGKIIYQNQNLIVSPEQDLMLDLPDVPPGRYIIRMTIEERESVGSFVLIK